MALGASLRCCGRDSTHHNKSHLRVILSPSLPDAGELIGIIAIFCRGSFTFWGSPGVYNHSSWKIRTARTPYKWAPASGRTQTNPPPSLFPALNLWIPGKPYHDLCITFISDDFVPISQLLNKKNVLFESWSQRKPKTQARPERPKLRVGLT